MEKYMIDLKGICYHDGKQHAKEWRYNFYKFNIFDNLANACDFIDKFVRDFPVSYKAILPNRVKRFNYFYSFSIYRINENSITEINHDSYLTEVVR